jgi:hypothetical protein
MHAFEVVLYNRGVAAFTRFVVTLVNCAPMLPLCFLRLGLTIQWGGGGGGVRGGGEGPGDRGWGEAKRPGE